jgi:phospholipase/carboxylesterase
MMVSRVTLLQRRGVAMRLATLAPIAAVVVLAACAGSGDGPEAEREPAADPQSHEGRTSAPPVRGGEDCRPGEHSLRVGGGRKALMRVTAGSRRGRKALILTLHGAGGGARDGLHAFRGAWDVPGVVLVAPTSRGSTWSFFGGRDVDVPVVERAVAQAFARCRIDPRLVAVGGFSDGASYALTIGLTNGDLFRGIIALSPGGAHTDSRVGAPRVFVAHGTGDSVLPVEGSDAIVRSLRSDGYRVTYRRFAGVHEVRPEIARASVRWFLNG